MTQRWFDVLGIHNDIVRRNVATFGGKEIKSQGDGFMLTFPSARKAVQACISVQQELGVLAHRSPDVAVRIRIGLHTGEAIVDDEGDLFGKHIIIAARVANLADGGQILASRVVREIASSRGDLDFGPGREGRAQGHRRGLRGPSGALGALSPRFGAPTGHPWDCRTSSRAAWSTSSSSSIARAPGET